MSNSSVLFSLVFDDKSVCTFNNLKVYFIIVSPEHTRSGLGTVTHIPRLKRNIEERRSEIYALKIFKFSFRPL